MTEPIYYHEDFYRQIELVPKENYFKTIKDISENIVNLDSDYGFVTIKERDELQIRTESLNIHIDAIKQELKDFAITFHDKVTSGYSNHIKIKDNTIAMSFERMTLFFESNNKGATKNIWMWQSSLYKNKNIDSCPRLFNALTKLGMLYNLILVDWNEEVAIRLTHLKTVQKYLEDNFSFNFPQ